MKIRTLLVLLSLLSLLLACAAPPLSTAPPTPPPLHPYETPEGKYVSGLGGFVSDYGVHDGKRLVHVEITGSKHGLNDQAIKSIVAWEMVGSLTISGLYLTEAGFKEIGACAE